MADDLNPKLVQKAAWLNEALGPIRQKIFEQFVEELRSRGKAQNTDIEGDALYALTAYEAGFVLSIIGEHGYLTEQEIEEFAPIFFSMISDYQWESCIPFFEKYFVEGAANPSARFLGDMIRHIAGEEADIVDVMGLQEQELRFTSSVHIAVYHCFGDTEHVESLKRNLGATSSKPAKSGGGCASLLTLVIVATVATALLLT